MVATAAEQIRMGTGRREGDQEGWRKETEGVGKRSGANQGRGDLRPWVRVKASTTSTGRAFPTRGGAPRGGYPGVNYALWDATGCHRNYSPCIWTNRAGEEQKRVGWEL